jgi:DNA-directed RNA polymerase II subunit RPB2
MVSKLEENMTNLNLTDSKFNALEFQDETWKVIGTMFGNDKSSIGKMLIKHQLESFNDFVRNKIEYIIDGFNDIEILHKFNPIYNDFKYNIKMKVMNPRLTKPVIYEKDGSTKIMTPNEARQRNFSYSSVLYVDIEVINEWYDENDNINKSEKTIKNINIGKIPIMIGSDFCVLSNIKDCDKNECMYDSGGYFIINGNEKVVISHDRIAENKTYVFLDTKATQYSHIAEIRSVPDNTFGPPKLTTIKLSSKSNQYGRLMRINIHHVRIDVPIFILFRALGIESDKQIIELCVYDLNHFDSKLIIEHLKGSCDESNFIKTREQALEYLSKYLNISGYPKEIIQNKNKRISIILEILRKDLLPHMGNKYEDKALYIGYMMRKLIQCFTGLRDFDDRDSYLNKRIDTPGTMLANLFRQYYGKVVKDTKNMVYKELNSGAWKSSNNIENIINKNNIYKIIKSTTIESGLKYGLATGNWGIKNVNSKQGVAQVLNRLTYYATLSHLRRVNTPIEKSGKLIQPRKLHNTQWGIICPAETPEGGSVGLVKNLAIAACITVASNSTIILEFLKDRGLELFSLNKVSLMYAHVWLILNGKILGTHANSNQIYDELIDAKRSGRLNIYTSIVWNIDQNAISISTEGGRSVRPLFIVGPNNKLLFDKKYVSNMRTDTKWNDMVSSLNHEGKSIVEFMDVEETNSRLIAMTVKDLENKYTYTHMEIHPSLILGVLASNIPFCDHNQAPRNTYQSAMGKQAIGIYASNFRHRLDTLAHVLNYPQKPLVNTKMAKIIFADEVPCGINVIVAIATFTGYNQEDSIMLNRSSVQRGLFASTYYRTIKEQCSKNLSTGEEELFCQPENIMKTTGKLSYDKLDDTGFIKENTFVSSGDVIVGKCMPIKSNESITYKDNSVVMKNNEYGFIDKNCSSNKYFTNISSEGYNFAKVRMRNYREPTIGDKLSSKHGQKGSIGMIYDQVDMPFTKDGLVPDIIINPHAIPSRMTIAQLVETIMGKVCLKKGCYGNSTPFTNLKVETITDALEKECGMESNGNEIMYNSRTGDQMKTQIFVGPTYYQRLKHMVTDKIHSRSSNGPIVLLTRQPAEGRARDGGLRLGEMEVECNWGHGTMQFLKERFMECSDNYRLFVCKKCNNVANVNPEKNIYTCNMCDNKINFSEIRIPYASKLMFQEIQSMGINTKFITAP